MKYAQSTSVPVEKTQAEINTLLRRAGATKFGMQTSDNGACAVLASLGTRNLMFEVTLPPLEEFAKLRPRGRSWGPTIGAEKATALWEQACRSKWRALLLVVKAKFTAVETGVETFDDAFLANIVVPGENGRSVRFGRWAAEQFKRLAMGEGPKMLGAGGAS